MGCSWNWHIHNRVLRTQNPRTKQSQPTEEREFEQNNTIPDTTRTNKPIK